MATTQVGTGGLPSVIRRGVVVLAAMRRQYEPSLWREETYTQLRRLLTGRRVGTSGGRDHDGISARRYSARAGGAPLWLRPGTGDSAIWGEVYTRGVYESPWPLTEPVSVLDLGGHAGYFARWALEQWPLTELISVEPDGSNFELLSHNRDAVADPRWKLLRAAAATAAGTATFSGGRGCGSGLSEEGEDTVPTVDALPLLAASGFAKIDIEGAEWALLDDDRFAGCCPPMLVLEYHPAPGIADPADEARRRLQALGYEVRDGNPEEVPGVGVLWARRQAV